MEEKDKLIWYEISVDVIPIIGTKQNKFYVEVNEYSQYSDDFGNMRYSINPRIGEYNNNDYWKAIQGRDDIKCIIIADTIMTLDEALKLEEYLVSGFRSCNEEFGYNKRKE